MTCIAWVLRALFHTHDRGTEPGLHVRAAAKASRPGGNAHSSLRGFPWRGALAILAAEVGGTQLPAITARAENITAGAGAVIYDNTVVNGGLNPNGASPASQWDSVFPFDAGAADDFVLSDSPLCTWLVTGVRWYGVYWGPADSGVIAGFRVTLWPDEGGSPGGGGSAVPRATEALAMYEVVGTAEETAHAEGAPRTHSYFTPFPRSFHALAGVRYWIEIQPKIAFPPQWGWHITNGRQGAGPVEYFDLLGLPAWISVPDDGDLAFQLFGEPYAVPCDDANACTTDRCDGDRCVFTPIGCEDANVCTTDSCDPVQGCVYAAVSCNDGNSCTEDLCDPVLGCSRRDITCDDGDACTIDTCSASGGCRHALMPCDDQDSCTADRCADGVCVHSAPGDFDGDGDVDTDDFSVLQKCLGALNTGGADPICHCADLSRDQQMDIRDYAAFQMVFTGQR